MLTTVVVAGVLVLAAAVLVSLWTRHGRRANRAEQVTAFEAARAVTSRWSTDADATPAPLQEYLHRQRLREQSPDDSDGAPP